MAKSIFQILDSIGITYAVCVTFHEIFQFTDWFIITDRENWNRLHGFHAFEGRSDVIFRDLTEAEVRYFKKIRDEEFSASFRNSSLTVFDRKGKSLKKELLVSKTQKRIFNVLKEK